MKAIIIARVSTEEQKEAGNSLPAQLIRLEDYCRNRGFEIIESHSFDESAYSKDRDKFDRIVDHVLMFKEKITLCFDKVDRLSRGAFFDKRIGILYQRALDDHIEIHFISDGQILNSRISAAQKFQFSISLGLSTYYSDAISDNVKRAQEQKIRKGEWLSKAPFGYKNIRLDEKNTDIIVDEHNAHIIKKAFEFYATGAYSMLTLCQKVKDEFGLEWSKGYMGTRLKNPFYHGVMIIKGKSYPHRYPPIISKSLFDQVQQTIAGFKKKSFKFAGLPFLYRGLIRCDECGLSISPERHKGYAYYHCTEYRGKHSAKWIREEDITKQLDNIFKSLQMPQHFLDEIINALAETHKNKMDFHNSQFDEFTKEQQELTQMMDELYMDKLRAKISDEQYDKFYTKFTAKKDDIAIRLSQLQEAEDNYYTAAKYVLELSKQAHDLFKNSELDAKRQLITLVLQNIKLNGKKIVWEARKPFDAMIDANNRNLWRG